MGFDRRRSTPLGDHPLEPPGARSLPCAPPACADKGSSTTSPRSRPGSGLTMPLRHNRHMSEITEKHQVGTAQLAERTTCRRGRTSTAVQFGRRHGARGASEQPTACAGTHDGRHRSAARAGHPSGPSPGEETRAARWTRGVASARVGHVGTSTRRAAAPARDPRRRRNHPRGAAVAVRGGRHSAPELRRESRNRSSTISRVTTVSATKGGRSGSDLNCAV